MVGSLGACSLRRYETGSLWGSIKSVGRGIGRAVGKVAKTAYRGIGRAVNWAANVALSVLPKKIRAALKAAGKSVMGAVANAVPVQGIVSSILAGKRLDRVALAAVKDISKTAGVAGKYLGSVPGVGTALGVGLGAAAAIGQGASLKSALIAGARNAIPGGPLARAAFDAGVGLAHGQGLQGAVLGAARKALPPAARTAMDAGIAASRELTRRERGSHPIRKAPRARSMAGVHRYVRRRQALKAWQKRYAGRFKGAGVGRMLSMFR